MSNAPDTVIKTTIKGFTLVPDVLVSKYGLVAATVWGIVRRHCEMERGVCDASLTELAQCIGVSKRTMINHIDTLCKDGYLEDTTPDLRNYPHTYRDTGKLLIESQTRVEFSGKKMRNYKNVDKEIKPAFSVSEHPADFEETPEGIYNG